MPVPSTRGRHCQNEHERGPMYTGVGEVNKARHGHATRPCVLTCPKNTGVGRMLDVPKFKIHETHSSTLWAPQHSSPIILPHSHRLDVSTGHLDHAKYEDDREITWHLPSLVSPRPVHRGGGSRGYY
ncbi:hypothetical protein GOBAR_AA00626 [Gossypium barbadense]|uniref:Uncharacterized protein n=1 Tax=Gossypium barbadense TaxID=3634 RepID=A0A2P5YWH2_GOSBA|nr:hypothetical protein GOBAR_AA00626 [Gossypium barbadense]